MAVKSATKFSVAAGPSWLSSVPSKRWGEKFFLFYSPFWMCLCAAVVHFKYYESFDGNAYVLLGAAVALPCVAIPFLFPGTADANLPLAQRYWVKVNVWIGIVGFIGNHFMTHYFYKLLGMRYTVPTDGWELNRVPLCMHLMTHAYFSSYHAMVTPILRRVWTSFRPGVVRLVVSALVVGVLAYVTAFMETWTISSFPHYTFPDRNAMLTVGSAFYALFFVATFPMFPRIDEGESWSIERTAVDALGASMLVLVFFDAWRLSLGPLNIAGTSAEAPYAG